MLYLLFRTCVRICNSPLSASFWQKNKGVKEMSIENIIGNRAPSEEIEQAQESARSPLRRRRPGRRR